MPVNGDTKLIVAGITPDFAEAGVVFDLSELTWLGSIREYLDYVGGDGWLIGNVITNISNIVLTIAPSHSVDTITYELVAPGNIWATITIPSLEDFVGLTGFTWSLSMNITHTTITFGSVTRSYNTTGQYGPLVPYADLAPAMTFTTGVGPPAKPTNPSPIDTATDIILGTDEVTWDDGGGADNFDVWFGPTGSMTLRESGQVGTMWSIPAEVLFYETGYEWQIVANNAYGATAGDTWTFDTILFYPPLPSGEAPGAGGEFGGEGGKNNMVTVKRIVAAANDTIFFQDG